jgi:hypothetical protein
LGAANQSEVPAMESKNNLEASFSALIFSFATAALMYLGLEKNPQTGKVEKNLDLAQLNIDWLIVLREKSKGNLSPEETNYLNAVITDLQIKFVQAK